MAYQSDESGRDEIYVDAFPEARNKVRISSGGGQFPEWNPDGRELCPHVRRNGVLAGATSQASPVRGSATDCLGHFWKADLGHFSQAPKFLAAGTIPKRSPGFQFHTEPVIQPSVRQMQTVLPKASAGPLAETPTEQKWGSGRYFVLVKQ